MQEVSNSSKRKIILILIFFTLLFVLLFGRMIYWQIIKADELSQKAYTQQTKNSIISPKRGSIYARNGVVLARSVAVETISVTPKNIKKKEETAKGLSELLELDYDTVLGKVNKTTVEEVIAKKVDKDITDKVREWIKEEGIAGINIYEDTKRYYPKGSFLAQVLGFCGTDNQGLEGLEANYEDVLKGIQGKRVTSKDATGKDMPLDDTTYIPSEDGYDIVLTIDERIQYFTEKYLDQAMEENSPVDYGTCIVMNPKNGEILAMATSPDYDPNSPFTPTNKKDILNWNEYDGAQKSKALQEMWKNKCVADTYEPGSVFKTVTAAIAIEEGSVTNVDAINYNCNGYLQIEDWIISCWRTTPHGMQSLRQGLMNSCNPVYMTVALRVGADKFYEYLNAFGVSKSTGSGIIGETSGIIHDASNVSKTTLATAGFGQGFTLTPLNMLNTICAIANDGKLLVPKLVKEIRDSNGKVIKSFDTEVVKQVVSESTSDTVLDMMESVVPDGTGRYAQVDGYYISGKTSTAEQGRGDSKTYVASFVALAPAKDPEVAILFNLYNPRGKNGHQGGGIVAPVVGKMMGEILNYLQMPKDYDTKEKKQEIDIPNVVGYTVERAKNEINNRGLKYIIEKDIDKNEIITSQVPIGGEKLSESGVVRIYTNSSRRELVEVPSVKGLGVSNAGDTIKSNNLNFIASGKGIAVIQEPVAGTKVEEGTIVTVEFRQQGIDVQ